MARNKSLEVENTCLKQSEAAFVSELSALKLHVSLLTYTHTHIYIYIYIYIYTMNVLITELFTILLVPTS